MSFFLQNLIARHREGGGGSESALVPFVRPRLKARFENELGIGASTGGFDQVDEVIPRERHRRTDQLLPGNEPDNGFSLLRSHRQVHPTVADITKSHQEVPVLQREQYVASLHEQSSAPRPRSSKQRLPAWESPPPDLGRYQAEEKRSVLGRQTTTEEGTFSQRIQEILHRLHAEQPQQNTPEKESGGILNSPVSAETSRTVSETPSAEDPVQAPLLTKPSANLPQQSDKESLGGKHLKQEPEARQGGVLQLPDWLQEMQLDLDKIQQPDKGQTQSEPVINVTIGRVEIRATQTSSGNKPKIRQQPSGIMSLDDYLKQREKRG